MTTMIDLKCKNCGAPLPLDTAVDNVVKCRYCTSTFTLPKNESEPAAVDAIRMGNMELDNCAFDRAATAFKKAIELDGDEPEGFMGLALATHRVQYLKDSVNNCLQPICHEISKDDFTKDTNYRLALTLSTDTQRNEYKRKGEEIDKIRKEFYALKQSGLDYDCFICVKVTGEDGKPTSDSHEALRLYHHLKDQGYKPFYSEEEIRGRAGAEYEALILYALRTSECMLIVCGNEDYLQTKWVKNEYTRFQSLINDEDKERDSITIVFNGRPIERLPGREGKIQGIDLSKPDAYTRISKYVEGHTPQARQRRADEANRKAAEEAERNRQFTEQSRKLAEMEEALRSLKNNGGEAQPQSGNNTQSLMKRAKHFLDSGDYASAKSYYNRVLDIDLEDGEAWFGCFLSENNASNESRLVESFATKNSVPSGMNYSSAKKYASDALKERIAKFEAEIESRKQEIRRLQQEAERKAREEAERKAKEAKEEAERREKAAREEAERKAIEEAEALRLKKIAADFDISGNVLRRYRGNGGVVTIPDRVTSIGKEAFKNCSKLTSITIPNSVTSIDYRAFYGCDSLTSITIPNSVTSIGSDAFQGCSSLTSIYYTGDIASWCGISGYGVFNPKVYIGNEKLTAMTSITIPNSVTSIGGHAFYYCSNLTSITIPNNVTSIGGWAFDGCSSLTSITIPNSVTYIGDCAFSNCSRLTSITIPDSVTSIGGCAFYKCSNLTSITIPNSVTRIGGSAFSGRSFNMNVTIPKRFKMELRNIFGEARFGLFAPNKIHFT